MRRQYGCLPSKKIIVFCPASRAGGSAAVGLFRSLHVGVGSTAGKSASLFLGRDDCGECGWVSEWLGWYHSFSLNTLPPPPVIPAIPPSTLAHCLPPRCQLYNRYFYWYDSRHVEEKIAGCSCGSESERGCIILQIASTERPICGLELQGWWLVSVAHYLLMSRIVFCLCAVGGFEIGWVGCGLWKCWRFCSY